LGTVDVIELEQQRSIVIYSIEIEPVALAEAYEAAVSEAMRNLPRRVT
jgi:hypothetical protein